MQETFLYSVNPRKVITGLSGANAIRTSKSLLLTKEDVKICLQRGSVYRRFSAENKIERVTVGNIDRLHRAEYVSEEDWAKVQAEEMSAGHGKVEEPVVPVEPEKVDPLVNVTDDEPKEDPQDTIDEDVPTAEDADDSEVVSDDEDEVEKVEVPVEESEE